MQKGFAPVLILVGILVIVAVAGGAYYFGKSATPKTSQSIIQPITTPQASPTPNETANWKTYTNTRYGFSFKYPAEYEIGSCRNCLDLSSSDFISLSPPNMSSAKGYGMVTINHLKDKEQNQSISDYLDGLSTMIAPPIVPGSKQRISVNGYPGLVVVHRDTTYDIDEKFVYLTNGIEGIVFSFGGFYSTENRGIHIDSFKNISVFDQILSTFRFTN